MIPRHDHAAALLVLFALSPCSRVDRICIVCYVNLTTSMSLLGNALMKANQPIFKFRPSFQVRIDILCSFPVHVVEGHDRLWRKSKEEISPSVARAAASTFLRSVDEITCKNLVSQQPVERSWSTYAWGMCLEPDKPWPSPCFHLTSVLSFSLSGGTGRCSNYCFTTCIVCCGSGTSNMSNLHL